MQDVDLYDKDPYEVLPQFLAPFDMWPDVRSQVETRFWKRESLYRTIMKNISAWNRVKDNIKYALQHQGSVATNVIGAPRSGKSTVARFLARETYRIQFGSIQDWELKVLFSRSYSRATEELQRLTQSLLDQEVSDDDIITQLQGYMLIEDELQIEREKDSKKAFTDMQTIAESCASSGIHFWYLSPTRKGFGYFTIWVVGIDLKKQQNLSFYLDNHDICYGYLITPNVPPFDAYTVMKNKIVVQTLAAGGRVPAVVKKLEKEEEIDESVVVKGVASKQLLDELLRVVSLHQPKNFERNTAIFKAVAIEGLSIGRVAKTHHLTDARVYQILGAFSEAIGIAFEHYLAGIQPAMWVRQGGKSEPDLINEEHKFVVSCKVMYGNKAKKTDQAIRDSKPELALKENGYSVYLIIFWVDTNDFTLQPI